MSGFMLSKKTSPIPLQFFHSLKKGETLVIGTSFQQHIDIMLSLIKKTDFHKHVTILCTDEIAPQLAIDSRMTIQPFAHKGSLSVALDWDKIRTFRKHQYRNCILLYHDQAYLRNRRGELLAILSGASHYFLFNIDGLFQHHSAGTLLRKFILATFEGSRSQKYTFQIYLLWIRLYARLSKLGRRLLASRKNF